MTNIVDDVFKGRKYKFKKIVMRVTKKDGWRDSILMQKKKGEDI